MSYRTRVQIRRTCAGVGSDRSGAQQAQLEKHIGDSDIYLMVGTSGASGYNGTNEPDHQFAERT